MDEDEGFLAEVILGREWEQKLFAFKYGYGRCEHEAVLGAFSNDNLPLATNYLSHTLRGSYGLRKDTALSLTWYTFRRLRPDPARRTR